MVDFKNATMNHLILPYVHLKNSEFRNYRKMFMDGFNYWMKVPKEKFEIIEDIFEIMFNSLYLIDDVVDRPLLKRGKPTAPVIYGEKCTLYAGILATLAIYKRCNDLNQPDSYMIITEQLSLLYQGTSMEAFWMHNSKCPTVEEFMIHASKKSTEYHIVPYRLMQLFSKNKTDYYYVTDLIGQYHCLYNDYISLAHSDYQDKSGFANDITEGKCTFPMMHAVRKDNGDLRLMNILHQKTYNIDVKKFFLDIMKKHGSMEYIQTILEEYRIKIREELKILGGNPYLEKFVEILQE